MKRVSKSKILEIINQINDEMLDNGDNSMSIYECFDFYDGDNKEIAKHLNRAIKLNRFSIEKILEHLYEVVLLCGCVAPTLITEELYKQGFLKKDKYEALDRQIEDAFIIWKIKNTRFSQQDFDDMLKKCHYTETKEWINNLTKSPYWVFEHNIIV